MSCAPPLALLLPCYDRVTSLKNAHCLMEELSQELSKTENVVIFFGKIDNKRKMSEYNTLYYDLINESTKCIQSAEEIKSFNNEMFATHRAFKIAHAAFLVSLWRRVDIYCSSNDNCNGLVQGVWEVFLKSAFTITNMELSNTPYF
jgi:hypothetical protein